MALIKNNLKRFVLGTIIVPLIVFIGYNRIQSRRYSDPQVFNPKKDKIVKPQIAEIKDEITLAGSIRASEIANLHFPSSGKLVWVGVKVGDRVKKWQALASLDRELLRKNLQTQFNNYRTSLSQFNDTNDQYKTTKEKLLVTDTIQRILDRTQYSLDNAVINYEITDMAYGDAVLNTPIAGVVTSVTTPVSGGYITPLDTSFTVINPSTIYFRSEIDEEAVTRINLNQFAQINLDSFPLQPIDSKITHIAFTPVEGQTSTVYEIRFELPLTNNDMKYRWGMGGDATVSLAKAKDALTLPIEAVTDTGDRKYVEIKIGDRLVQKDVKTGIENDTSIQILEGLTSDDPVVIKSR